MTAPFQKSRNLLLFCLLNCLLLCNALPFGASWSSLEDQHVVSLQKSSLLPNSISEKIISLWDAISRFAGFKNEGQSLRVLEGEGGKLIMGDDNLKLKLKKNGVGFMDITDHMEFYQELESRDAQSWVKTDSKQPETSTPIHKFPSNVSYSHNLSKLFNQIAEENMQLSLATLSSYHTRYYKSESGLNASLWLATKVQSIIDGKPPSTSKGNASITVHTFPHPWGQKSIIATIPGLKNIEAASKHRNLNAKPDPASKYNAHGGDVIIASAHLDSINLLLPSILSAPGADDNGSGTVTILEVFRILVESGFRPVNTIQFHWYSAEEGGLLGSQAVMTEYKRRGVQVRALLQQDMTGYIGKGVSRDEDASFGLMTDYVDPFLTNFMKLIIDEYSNITYTEDKCGYGCSDHASAHKVGYPSSFVMEAPMKKSNPFIHTVLDTVDRLSFAHMAQHAKITLGYLYELGMFDFPSE